ncbi:MAG: D-tyrosyl-tRNA(Tyr) deacylase [Verrucomicrobiales bacterium]|jgi:D-tyrosyl-tRNA(Tyr) deacylase|nr:D-tyrosyl-tRNA(Tyr) deacylase [Verrucomicrobiales bacterium]
MKTVVQRVSRAEVRINGEPARSIGAGLVILLGVEPADTDADAAWLLDKILKLRLFDDNEGFMDLSLGDIDGELLVVSQFTLFASTKKGTKPSFHRAAKPEIAVPLYELFVRLARNSIGPDKVKTGTFGAMMSVELVNDGPVTLILDSKNKE